MSEIVNVKLWSAWRKDLDFFAPSFEPDTATEVPRIERAAPRSGEDKFVRVLVLHRSGEGCFELRQDGDDPFAV